jgi:tRNA (guanine37-N1)-methyltransferase
MQIGVITLFPEMFDAVADFGITARALDRGLLALTCCNPREFTSVRHPTVDDRPNGGGPGMVMKPEPLQAALDAARRQLPAARTAYMSPQGRPLTQSAVAELARREQWILVAGRYEGVDERLLEAEIDEEWSIGDYVLSGGELAAMVLIDAVTRLLPGALGHEQSAAQDSFAAGLLDHPHYTRPEDYRGRRAPAVLLGGDHEQIRRWRLKQALGRTWQRRPELLAQRVLDREQQALLDEFIREQHPSN